MHVDISVKQMEHLCLSISSHSFYFQLQMAAKHHFFVYHRISARPLLSYLPSLPDFIIEQKCLKQLYVFDDFFWSFF